jgi:outer membrane protein assembly factor BamD
MILRIAVFGVLLLALAAPGCRKKDPSFEDVPPANELYDEGLKRLEGRNILGYRWINHGKAIESFQAIIDNYPYSSYEIDAELQIADAYYASKRYEEALSYYRDFAELHPQHPKVPYTILRSALCHYEQIESIDRDQTNTRAAMRILEDLLGRYPYTPETKQGEVILFELRTRLAENVMEIGDFYLKREQYQSAATRYRSVLDGYPGLGLDAEALFKLGLCYEHLKLEDEALRLYHVVLENFRNTQLAAKAAERIAEAN